MAVVPDSASTPASVSGNPNVQVVARFGAPDLPTSSVATGSSTMTSPSMHTQNRPVPVNEPPTANEYPPSNAMFSNDTILSQANSTSAQKPDLIPFGASQIDRYNRQGITKVRYAHPMHAIKPIEPNKRTFEGPKVASKTSSWKSCVHPEGALYFYDTHRRIFTDSDLRIAQNCKDVEYWFDHLVHSATDYGIVLPDDNIEITLQLTPKQGIVTRCRYYLVDKKEQLLFWLQSFSPTEIYGNVTGVKERLHIKCALQVQYCIGNGNKRMNRTHCELYPYNRAFDETVFFKLRGIILHANADKITSDTSLAPFEPDELSKMMDIMNDLRDSIGKKDEYSMCVMGTRFMRMFTQVHFLNFHGQINARLDADQSIYETQDDRTRTSVILRIINPVLFGAPAVHLEDLRGVWVDRTVNQPRWKAFITNMNTQWAGFTIYVGLYLRLLWGVLLQLCVQSTVMLAVDVSFLAVPGVEPQYPNSGPQPVGVVAIYVSILCTIGSLVASIVLSSQSRRTGYGTADATVRLSVFTSSLALEGVVRRPYPMGFLCGGAMVAYIVALFDFIFSSAYFSTRILIGLVCLPIVVFGLWPIWGGNWVLSRFGAAGGKDEADHGGV
ncbi:hypothetical protein BU15DRAFT_76281 [Melanogaster broomeanus]|nr:hypothetical protein BU15DRAFT_76281 [Melanogaster broomeanus]